MEQRLSWPERIYLHNRARLPWAVSLPAVLAIVDLWTLYRAATRQVIYGRIAGGRDYIRLIDHPTEFWITVAIHSAALAALTLILIWLLLGFRAAKARAGLTPSLAGAEGD